jgi:hypothetical protein
MIKAPLALLSMTLATLVLLSAPFAHGQLQTHGTDTPSYIDFDRASYTVNEQAGTLEVTVVRMGDFRRIARVDYALLDGNAEAAGDFTPQGGTLVFAPNENRKTITVGLLADQAFEETEHCYVQLSNPGPYTELFRDQATILIEDSLAVPPRLLITPVGVGRIKVSWQSEGTKYTLERTTDTGIGQWEAVPEAVVTSEGESSVEQSILGQHFFFRLRAQSASAN